MAGIPRKHLDPSFMSDIFLYTNLRGCKINIEILQNGHKRPLKTIILGAHTSVHSVFIRKLFKSPLPQNCSLDPPLICLRESLVDGALLLTRAGQTSQEELFLPNDVVMG